MTKRTWLLVGISVVGLVAWRWSRGSHDATTSDAADDGGVAITDRIWLDHVPASDRDVINALIVLGDEHLGVYQKTSAWRGGFEAFRWTGKGAELRLVFPQTGDRETIRAKARRCDADGMDFCLEVAGGSRGVARYYSRKGWEIDGHGGLRAAEARAEAIEAAPAPGGADVSTGDNR